MTDLERAIVHALRLSNIAAEDERIMMEIRRNIEVAKEELVRSGVANNVVEEGSALVEDAIITFCLVKMGSEDERDRNASAFLYQQDNLRKS